jgi:hypothetical protein
LARNSTPSVAGYTPWRDRPLLQLKTASEIAGVSPASLYRFSDEGKLKLRELGGRTLVDPRVPQPYQAGTMFGGDDCRRFADSARIANSKKGGKFFRSERFGFGCHHPTMPY